MLRALLRLVGLVPLLEQERERAVLTVRLELAEAQVVYWRTRAEKFIDASAARAGLIHEPTMRDAPKPILKDPLRAGLTALGVQEIDSRRH